jgi:histone H3/H4
MSDLIVKVAVKDVSSEQNVSADFYNALDEEVAELLDDAAPRAEANDRKTVQPGSFRTARLHKQPSSRLCGQFLRRPCE